MFIELLASIVNGTNHTKFISLNNQQYMARPNLTDLNSDEYDQGLRYHPLTINLDRSYGICNTLDDLSDRIFVSNKTEVVHLSNFNKLTRKTESKTLGKLISCECKCKFDGRKCNSNQKWNKRKRRCERKNLKKHHMCEKIKFGIFLNVLVKMVNI